MPQWAASVSRLRHGLNLSQTAFGNILRSSAMAISRWERGTQEPSAGSYIELGNLAGAPICWYFWGRAGLHTDDVIGSLPESQPQNQMHAINLKTAHAGSGRKRLNAPELIAIPVLKIVVASHGEEGEAPTSTSLHDAPVESVIAAPKEWCPNPSTTTCLRVKGNSMKPLIYDGYIVVVDTSQQDHSKLDGKIVIARNKDKGLVVSRLQAYDHTEVLRAENSEYKSVVLGGKEPWKIVGKVLWWIGQAP
jgi:SOS-response transcriptional repressor LexA